MYLDRAIVGLWNRFRLHISLQSFSKVILKEPLQGLAISPTEPNKGQSFKTFFFFLNLLIVSYWMLTEKHYVETSVLQDSREFFLHGVLVSRSGPDGDEGNVSSLKRTHTKLLLKLILELLSICHRKTQTSILELCRHLHYSERDKEK